MIADTPQPLYWAVIFTHTQGNDLKGYAEMAAKMEKLAAEQPGYLGFESARDGLGIAISYWRDEEAIHAWKRNVEHRLAQRLGREKWYTAYKTRVCRIERDYDMASSPDNQ